MHRPQRAEEILRQLSISTPEMINLEAIAWSRRAKVRYRAIDGCEACINGSAELGRAIIAVNNEGSSLRRQRFSLAHELGHWEWHRGRKLFCSKQDIGGAGKLRTALNPEKVANKFAAELLMPAFMLKATFSKSLRFNMETVTELASMFDVSRTAMVFRLVELELEPSLLLAYSREGRRWFIRSSNVSSKWFPRKSLERHSSAYDILYYDARDDVALSEVDAGTWFDTSDEIELYELSFRTGRDEVVTLLVSTDERILAD